MLHNRFRAALIGLALGDLLVVLFAYLVAFWLRARFSLPGLPEPLPPSRFFEVEHLFGLLLASHAVLLYSFGLYDERLLRLDRGRLVRFAATVSVLEVLILVGYRFFTTPLYLAQGGSALYFPRSVYLLFLPLGLAGGVLWRLAFHAWLRRHLGALRVALVGTGPNAREMIGEILRRPETGLEVVGVFEDNGSGAGVESQFCGVPVLGPRTSLVEIARRERISEIIIASSDAAHERLVETIARSDLTEARVSIIPGLYELLIGKVHRLQVHDIPLVEVLREPTSRPGRLLKRLLDLVFAALIAILAAPVMTLAALLIRLADGSPVVFCQERVGKRRKPFRLYKFRTMTPDAERATGPVLAAREDARVTPLGRVLRKYRIDELPQLWNVLRGDMSLVGPRPERPEFVQRFVAEVPGYAERFKVKPGITGLAQVRGTYETSAQNKLRYDLAYVYNQSLGLDLSILAQTVKEVLNSRGW
jgi:exopolysaccharide biosynthesis polyprenyl glycosylphosphotransferase